MRSAPGSERPEESVLEAAFRLRERNPCGYLKSIPPSWAIAHQRDGEIHVPVLIVCGNNDTLIWTRQGQEEQQSNYSGTSDVSTVFIEKAGHFLMLERTVPTLRAVVSSWLCERGLVARPCRGR
jgi:pimeloyl-ACP methyl ester carboxylesterase